jgi:hypothetical protein
MSSPPSKLQAALLTGSQETNVALLTNDFDFSLVKVQAPPEFRQLWSRLSKKRLHLGEEGSQHVTARMLGALSGRKLQLSQDCMQHTVAGCQKLPRCRLSIRKEHEQMAPSRTLLAPMALQSGQSLHLAPMRSRSICWLACWLVYGLLHRQPPSESSCRETEEGSSR